MPAHNKGAVHGMFLHLKKQVTQLCVQHGSISVEVTYRLLKRTRRNTLKMLSRGGVCLHFYSFYKPSHHLHNRYVASFKCLQLTNSHSKIL